MLFYKSQEKEKDVPFQHVFYHFTGGPSQHNQAKIMIKGLSKLHKEEVKVMHREHSW